MKQIASKNLSDLAKNIRKQIITSLHKTGGGHYGGALSVLDPLLVLYHQIARVYPDQPENPLRDRIILSKGHACIAQYCILADLGFFDKSELEKYGTFHSFLEGHPDMTKTPGIDFSTGSLGQGLSVGLGMSFSLQKDAGKVWVIMGDGECQEGQVWEAVMLADRYKANKLVTIVDYNGHQEYGWSFHDNSFAKNPVPNITQRFASFGWNVIETDGHDYETLQESFERAQAYAYGPTAVICNTVKGKGYKLIESDPVRFHCGELSEEEFSQLT